MLIRLLCLRYALRSGVTYCCVVKVAAEFEKYVRSGN